MSQAWNYLSGIIAPFEGAEWSVHCVSGNRSTYVNTVLLLISREILQPVIESSTCKGWWISEHKVTDVELLTFNIVASLKKSYRLRVREPHGIFEIEGTLPVKVETFASRLDDSWQQLNENSYSLIWVTTNLHQWGHLWALHRQD